MIFVTGDTHCRIDFQKLRTFSQKHKELTKNDYVIIAGDFGGVWFKPDLEKDLNLYSSLRFTVLFVDGNHENFSLLNAYPVTEWNGGKVHKIRDDIIHLMRGQVFELEGKAIFTFGGATSIDKEFRQEGKSWWQEEIPNFEELDEGFRNLERYNYTVDYIITHSCDEKALWYPPLRTRDRKMGSFPENALLSNFEDRVNYKHWYFGHYHMDGQLTERKTVVYNQIVELK